MLELAHPHGHVDDGLLPSVQQILLHIQEPPNVGQYLLDMGARFCSAPCP